MKILRRDYRLSELWALRSCLVHLLLDPRRLSNVLVVKTATWLRREFNPGLPLNILVEPTSACDCRCIKCARNLPSYADDGPGEDGYRMPFDRYRQILDELGDTLLTLRLWHQGNPMLHPDLCRMIAYAKRKGVFVAVSATLSSLDNADALVRSGLDYLIVSLDAATPETYQRYYGRDAFGDVRKNLQALQRARRHLRSRRPFVELQFIVMKENESQMDAMRAIATECGADKLTYLRLDANDVAYGRFPGIDGPEDVLPANPEYRRETSTRRGRRTCRVPWEETLIRYSGLVLSCASDHGQRRPLGRLGRGGFRVVWNGPRYRALRRRVAAGLEDLDVCSTCGKQDNDISDQV
jgi:MoaA/NifB/PqqE/SkfB family radical SAM enzyme